MFLSSSTSLLVFSNTYFHPLAHKTLYSPHMCLLISSYSLFHRCSLQILLALLLDYSSPPALSLVCSGEGHQAGSSAPPPPISWQQAETLHCMWDLWSAISLLPEGMLCLPRGMLKPAVPCNRLVYLATPPSLVTPNIKTSNISSKRTPVFLQYAFSLRCGVCSHGCTTQYGQCLLPLYSLQVGQ